MVKISHHLSLQTEHLTTFRWLSIEINGHFNASWEFKYRPSTYIAKPDFDCTSKRRNGDEALELHSFFWSSKFACLRFSPPRTLDSLDSIQSEWVEWVKIFSIWDQFESRVSRVNHDGSRQSSVATLPFRCVVCWRWSMIWEWSYLLSNQHVSPANRCVAGF